MSASVVTRAPGGVVFAKTMRDQRRGLIGWSIGIVGLVLTYVAVWPSIRDSAAQMNEYIRSLPEVMRELFVQGDYSTPIGYVSSEIFGQLGMLLLVIAGIGLGARAIAAEEEGGTLDVLVASPITRRSILLEKAGAIAVQLTAFGVVLAISIPVFGALVDLGVPADGLISATIGLVLLGLAFGSIALLIGAWTGRRGVAIGLTTALAVGAFVIDGLSKVVDELEPARFASPFFYYSSNEPLRNGLDPVHTLVLAGIGVVAIAIAVLVFERRDLSG
jgi:ABC-2 type transport system permease protein